jgi:hypothetical protein
MLTSGQLRTLSDIFVGLGHIVIAASVLPAIFPDATFGSREVLNMASGLSAALLFWTMSLLLIRE